MDEIFSPADQRRMHDLVDVIWAKDERMPQEEFLRALPMADAVVTSGWHYGDVLGQAQRLKAIMDVSGSFPLHLDYEACYQRRIRVLSAAPGFARQVAEFSLGLAIDAARQISYGDRLMRRGEEQYLWHGNVDTFLLYDQPVGIIGYGGLARALHPLLIPFGVSISVYDPWLSEGYLRRQGLKPLSLEELMATSKFIFVMAVPSTENRSDALARTAGADSAECRADIGEPRPRHRLSTRPPKWRWLGASSWRPMSSPSSRCRLIIQFARPRAPRLSAHRAGSVAQGMVELGRDGGGRLGGDGERACRRAACKWRARAQPGYAS